jgi:ubiquinone/menaquinone biosynthesis C-methylase UbiE
MRPRLIALGKRYARFATRVAVSHPRLWPFVRAPLRWNFDFMAPMWDACRAGTDLSPLDAAVSASGVEPRRILDLGTGSGVAARHLAERFPQAEVVGADLSEGMVSEARRLTTSPHVSYALADAASLPFGDGAFDLVVLLNMIPFARELARVTRADGAVAIVFSGGPQTPIYAPPAQLRRALTAAGFASVEELDTGEQTTLLARR